MMRKLLPPSQRRRDPPIRIKSPKEIDGIRRSCKLAAATLEYLVPYVVPGISTLAINDLAEKFVRGHGATPAPLGYKGYPKATCTSVNEVICHGIPSDKVFLQEGDIINVDITTILDGYFGDTSRMYAVGIISEDAKKLLKVTRDCLDIGITQVYPGNRFGNIGYYIQLLAQEHGLSVVSQYCGHGVGVEFHESPQVCHTAPKDSGSVMAPGMIFTVEPMLNIGSSALIVEQDRWTARTEDGSLSAQFEHTVLVTDSTIMGCEILTQGTW